MNAEIRIKSEYRSSLRSKALIRKALLDLMDEKPYEKITITDIVKKANVNRGTFYLHFKDIPDVLHSIGIGVIDEIMSKIETLEAREIISSPEKAFYLISDFLSQDIGYYQRLITLDVTGFAVNEAKRRTVDFLMNYIKNSSEDYGDHPELVINYILAGVGSIYCDILSGGVHITLEEAPLYLGRLTENILSTYKMKSLTAAIAE